MNYADADPNVIDSPYAPTGMRDSTGSIYMPLKTQVLDKPLGSGAVGQSMYETMNLPDPSKDNSKQRMLDRVRQNGEYESIGAFQRDLDQELRKDAAKQGIDLSSDQGRQWMAKATEMATKQAGMFVAPPGKFDVKELKDGTVLSYDAISGKSKTIRPPSNAASKLFGQDSGVSQYPTPQPAITGNQPTAEKEPYLVFGGKPLSKEEFDVLLTDPQIAPALESAVKIRDKEMDRALREKAEGRRMEKEDREDKKLAKEMRTLPRQDQDTLNQHILSLKSLDAMEKNMDVTKRAPLDPTGRVRGVFAKGQAWAGFNKKAIDFDSAKNNLKLAAQAMIKGTPSNFDIQTVIDTLPDLMLPEDVNKSRLEFTREVVKELVMNTTAFYKYQGKELPPEIVNRLKGYKIDPDSIKAWNGEGDPLDGAIEKAKSAPQSQAQSKYKIVGVR